MELHYLMSWTTVLKVTPFSVSLSVREVSAKAYPEAEMFSWRISNDSTQSYLGCTLRQR